MSEFSLIEKYCRGLGAKHQQTSVGIGDDGAVLDIPAGKQLVVSVDTMVEGVHFFADVDVMKLAHKLIAVNASDIGAMGGKPMWATLALTLPDRNDTWLTDFSAGLDLAAGHFGIELVGGDTTRGPLTLSLQVMGLVDAGKSLLRSGAKIGDVVLVTGVLGDAALALRLLKQNITPSPSLLRALEQPEPPCEFGSRLAKLASSAIDVSDGLVADLTHIAKASGVGLRVDADSLPLSQEFIQSGGGQELALYGGDDYQLAFTLAPEKLAEADAQANILGVALTRIGQVEEKQEAGLIVHDENGKIIDQSIGGYDHFQS